MGRKLTSYSGNDIIFTPDILAKAIVNTLTPEGILFDPCCGEGAFLRAFKEYGAQYEWAEINKGIDFFNVNTTSANWVITNPPFSKIMAFLKKSIELNIPNIAFLCTINVIWMNGKLKLLKKYGYSLEYIYLVESPYFRKYPGWVQSGFSLGLLVIQKTNKPEPISKNILTGNIDW